MIQIKSRKKASIFILTLSLVGCGGGSGGSSTPPPVPTPTTYIVSGTVTGLTSGHQVTLLNNAADPQVLTTNSGFKFDIAVKQNGSYAVTVGTQPFAQTCNVTNGSGTNVTANISNVSVVCSNPTAQTLYSFAGPTSDGSNPLGPLTLGSDGNFYGSTSAGGTTGNGAIYKISPAGVETLLYSFAGGTSDSSYPTSALTLGTDGNFYGVTEAGGLPNYGTVYKVTPAGVETVLHAFTGNTTDGQFPIGSLTLGADGNFYGTTNRGGTNDLGTVFKITPAGVETILYSFSGGTADGSGAAVSLTLGKDGNFYGVTSGGGAAGTGTIYKVTPTGTESVLYSFGADMLNCITSDDSLVVGADGNFYGMTNCGGSTNNGTVYKITPAGVQTLLYTFAGGTLDGAMPDASLTLGTDGNLYGLTSGGGANGKGTIFEITPAGVESVLYSFADGGANGPLPRGLTLGSDGSFYGTTLAGGSTLHGSVFKY